MCEAWRWIGRALAGGLAETCFSAQWPCDRKRVWEGAVTVACHSFDSPISAGRVGPSDRVTAVTCGGGSCLVVFKGLVRLRGRHEIVTMKTS